MPDDMNDIKTIADTIVWMGDERLKTGKYQNRNSAIHSVTMEVSLLIQEVMAKNMDA